ncbi:hypothetical protein [Streptomyces sp. NPDC000405]|uniref:hypothetical protein n=1 Tax=Streptomyces sp. NPDC000405 TaxID=3161033 RepID=UPI00398D3187
MGAFFPELKELGPVGEAEWETLRSLNRAYTDLRGEWESARARTFGLMTKLELLKDYTALDHYLDAVHEAYHAACAYERQISASTWRYASAAAVLGVMVTDRLAAGRPPLSGEAVRAVADEEPTLAQLRQTVAVRHDQMLTEDEDGLQGGERRRALVQGVESAYDCVMNERSAGVRRTETEAGACRLTEVSPEGTEPFWIDLLEPVLDLAESMPTDIARWVRHRGRARLF